MTTTIDGSGYADEVQIAGRLGVPRDWILTCVAVGLVGMKKVPRRRHHVFKVSDVEAVLAHPDLVIERFRRWKPDYQPPARWPRRLRCAPPRARGAADA